MRIREAGCGPTRGSTYTYRPMLGFLSRFVDSNDRELKRIQPFVDEANELEAEIEALQRRRDQGPLRRASATSSARSSGPEEPSDDELHHPDLERRRELAKARRKRENDRIQAALDDVAAGRLRDGPRGHAAGRSGCATSTSS